MNRSPSTTFEVFEFDWNGYLKRRLRILSKTTEEGLEKC
jgi:hypothetical protein